ncbi:hypothetical protein [Paenarthrobacter nitroguajacolicus]
MQLPVVLRLGRELGRWMAVLGDPARLEAAAMTVELAFPTTTDTLLLVIRPRSPAHRGTRQVKAL